MQSPSTKLVPLLLEIKLPFLDPVDEGLPFTVCVFKRRFLRITGVANRHDIWPDSDHHALVCNPPSAT
ncbi:MAG: hypothetical protein UY50_C0026G0007 [Parcubacteria group bacterium GW2011_GWA2_49_9]|nr:MAG: hypothetical protein UY50_C0026G0007 [Parcubacteria group bacterium GW2011_GWA2_49_9]